MSTNEYVSCDGKCGKESKDFHADGWIMLQGKLIKHKGRNTEGYAELEVCRDSSDIDGGLHFCSATCLLALEERKAFFKVTFDTCSNTQATFGNCSDPRKFLSRSKTYEVTGVEVHSHHTRYQINDKWYNSVCFKKVTK